MIKTHISVLSGSSCIYDKSGFCKVLFQASSDQVLACE